MEWIKNMSLKKAFLAIITISIIVAILTGILFDILCNYVIEYFDLSIMVPVMENYYDNEETILQDNSSVVIMDEGEVQTAYYYKQTIEPGYTILSTLKVIMPVIFVLMAFIYADILFYQLKLKTPIEILRNGAERIQKQDLDFEIPRYGSDELGELCTVFEIMRKTLLTNNHELWRQAEERKRLNAAFAHDLRNPVTVLKGAAKLLQKGVDNGTLNAYNGEEGVRLICQYVGRIERYVEIMTKAQKLEELECNQQVYDKEEIQMELRNSLSILAEDFGKKLEIIQFGDVVQVCIDKQYVYNTVENLTSNALRYARNKVVVKIIYQEKQLNIVVCDDGNGFSAVMLKKGVSPFSRSEISDGEHFGMGLYICKLLCEKHGGNLTIENAEHGAKVTASFNF